MRLRSLTLAVAIASFVQCREPTEITLVITTDLDCAALTGTLIVAGRAGALDGSPAISTTQCLAGADGQQTLGTVVLSPSTDREAPLQVEITAGVGVDPSTCDANPSACIVSRRSLHYIAHTPLTLPIQIRGACLGMVCPESQTCVDGACVAATVTDPGGCSGSGCGLDAGAPDSSVPVGRQIASLSVGATHACVALASGAIKCWGSDNLGQLGDGASGVAAAPVLALLPPTSTPGVVFTGVSAGDTHTCATLSDFSVACWGDNAQGQLGDGTTSPGKARPVLAQGLKFTDVSAGRLHTCARTPQGAVYCWGDNSAGEIGNGSMVESAIPVLVPLRSAARQVSVGVLHDCAALVTGQVFCWGANDTGQLGDGTTTQSSSPVAVLGVSSATQVSAGLSQSCALLTGGAVWCWGGNAFGELGDGTFTTRGKAAPASLPSPATAVSAGHFYTCALLGSHKVVCWGSNSQSELGDGTKIRRQLPVMAIGSHGVVQVQARGGLYGTNYTCDLLGSDSVECWGGSGGVGTLGDGQIINNSPTPVTVLGLP